MCIFCCCYCLFYYSLPLMYYVLCLLNLAYSSLYELFFFSSLLFKTTNCILLYFFVCFSSFWVQCFPHGCCIFHTTTWKKVKKTNFKQLLFCLSLTVNKFLSIMFLNQSSTVVFDCVFVSHVYIDCTSWFCYVLVTRFAQPEIVSSVLSLSLCVPKFELHSTCTR